MPTVLHIVTVADSLIFLRGQGTFLRENGFFVAAVSSPGPLLQRFGHDEGVRTFPIPMARRISPLRDLVALTRLLSVIAKLNPEIVHAHTPKAGLLGMIAGALTGRRVRIYHMRGLPFVTASGWRRALLRSTERLSCKLATRVICQSHSLRRAALVEALCEAEKSTVLAGGSNGVDGSRFDPARFTQRDREEVRARLGIPADAPVVGFVGRLVRDKGVVELAEAWATVRERFPTAHLLIVGPFEERDAVSESTRSALERDPRIHIVGYQDDTAPYYAVMQLVVLPTYREGFPNVPLEAAAMRLPVVATEIPGCVDAVAQGHTGTLVPVADAVAVADAVCRYLGDPELREKHGGAGRSRVLEHFTRRRVCEALLEEYRSALPPGDADVLPGGDLAS